MKEYYHLDYRERSLIYWWRKDKVGLREIGRRLKRSHTTISRELKRNLWCGKHYYPRGAQMMYAYRIEHRAKRYRLKSKQVRTHIYQKLSIGWTPELISGRLKHQNKLPYVCQEAIYQYIYSLAKELIEYLPRKHKKRKTKHPYRQTGKRIKNRKSLDLRPVEASERQTIGHWESDTIESGDRKHGLNVLVERKCRLTHISLLSDKCAATTQQVVIKRLKPYSTELEQTITYDNGSENTYHEDINEALGSESFFCAPYHSWEKGSVEQVNGLVRRFLPKGSNFNTLTHGDINRIEKLLNNRPRKCLNYRTPYEVFREERGALNG